MSTRMLLFYLVLIKKCISDISPILSFGEFKACCKTLIYSNNVVCGGQRIFVILARANIILLDID